MASKNLIVAQLGKQSVWDTAVASTSILQLLEEPTVEVSVPPIKVGKTGTVGVGVGYVPGVMDVSGTIKYDLSYEDVLYLIAGLAGLPTPTGTNPYTWSRPLPTFGMPTNAQVFTIETGSIGSGVEYRVTGGVWKNVKISGASGEVVKGEIGFIAQKYLPQAMTTGLSMRTVNPIVMTQAQLYIDDWAGTIGTTELPAQLIDFSLEIETNRHLKPFGKPFASNWGEGVWESKLTLTLEFDATVKAHADALLNNRVLARQIAIRFTDATRQFEIQYAGVCNGELSYFEDRDNNVTIAMTFDAVYHATMGTWCLLKVINGMNTLP